MKNNVLYFKEIDLLNLFLKAYLLKLFISKDKHNDEFQEEYDWILSFLIVYMHKEKNNILINGIPLLNSDDFIKYIDLDIDDYFKNNKVKATTSEIINIIENKFPMFQDAKNSFYFLFSIVQNNQQIYHKIINDVLSHKFFNSISEYANVNNHFKYILEDDIVFLDDNISIYELDTIYRHISFNKLFYENYKISTIYKIAGYDSDDLVTIYNILNSLEVSNDDLLNHLLSIDIAILRASYADAYIKGQKRVDMDNLYSILNKTKLLKQSNIRARKMNIN